MIVSPSFEDFARAYEAGRPQVVLTRVVSDLDTPVGAYLKLTRGARARSFLLESVEGGATRGRYSIIGFDPDLVWRCRDGRAEIERHPGTTHARVEACGEPPLASLRRLIAAGAIDPRADLPPMASGLFGFLGYEMVRHMERLPPMKPDPIGLPEACLIRPRMMVVFDTVRDETTLVATTHPAAGLSARVAYEAALERLEAAVAALDSPLQHGDRETVPPPVAPATSNTSEVEYLAMVERAKEYIRAGDIFQVVLSQRFETPFPLPALSLYRALRRVNPAPFLSYLDFGDFQVVCSSPEILVRLRDGKVTIRPIAGTRPRGVTPSEDAALAQELIADPKERAEHLMLLDLGRNDVGRVSRIGSVNVPDSFFIERYSHVMHIVSNVEGEIAPGHDAIDALVAGFPAGTVSGAPKIRAMEIIDELEKDRRGVYAGAIGYFGASGEMDTCIVLRTAVVKDGRMHVQAGAGIVYDSDPASEQRECINKARALFSAAEEAVRFASTARRGQ
jgi:anthranilate synthase component 1